MVGSIITKLLLECLNDDNVIFELNETFITFIPKIKHLTTMTNVLYRFFSNKTLVRRIKLLLN